MAASTLLFVFGQVPPANQMVQMPETYLTNGD